MQGLSIRIVSYRIVSGFVSRPEGALYDMKSTSTWIRPYAGVLLWTALVLGMGLHSFSAAAQSIGKPVYDPDSKSYFELRNDNADGVWPKARQLAESKIYKGIQGRLAVVKSVRTHNFLRKNFKLENFTWIGLRYWCKFRKLQWVTGEIHKAGEFSPWAMKWFRTATTVCGTGTATGDGAFMPVYYSPADSDRGFTWQASGPGKGFEFYLVEYPTAQGQAQE